MRKHPLMMASIAAPLLLVALAACGSSESSGEVASGGGAKITASGSTAGAGTADKNRGVEYTKCMRANGVNMADPDPGKSPIVVQGSPGSKEQKAFDACKQFLPDGGVPEKVSPAELAQIREYTKCMRANGVDMPDPGPDGGIGGAAGGDTTKLEAADKICQSKMPGQQ
jgi:hypothetical protein